MNLMSELRKDNTGLNLKHMFIGAEGTLGIITAAVLRLYRKPLAYVTAMVGLRESGLCHSHGRLARIGRCSAAAQPVAK